MKFVKLTKNEVVLGIVIYFVLFALTGLIFSVLTMAMAWSVSIFIYLWCGYWLIIYSIDMYYYMQAMLEIMEEDFKKMTNKGNKK